LNVVQREREGGRKREKRKRKRKRKDGRVRDESLLFFSL